MLLEKAWAKVKGNYYQTDGGFMQNGFRTLLGCPIVGYETTSRNYDTIFNVIKSADENNYILGATTAGQSDEYLNECGIANAHAYTLISAFELKTGATVDHKMYMMRNPWGISYFNKTWNQADTASWTS